MPDVFCGWQQAGRQYVPNDRTDSGSECHKSRLLHTLLRAFSEHKCRDILVLLRSAPPSFEFLEFFSTAFSVFNLLFRASSIRFSVRSFSASVISDSALRLPRLSTRPSMPFSLYFSHPGIDLLVADAESLNSSSVVISMLDAVADNFNPFFVCRSPYFLQIAAWLPSPLNGWSLPVSVLT